MVTPIRLNKYLKVCKARGPSLVLDDIGSELQLINPNDTPTYFMSSAQLLGSSEEVSIAGGDCSTLWLIFDPDLFLPYHALRIVIREVGSIELRVWVYAVCIAVLSLRVSEIMSLRTLSNMRHLSMYFLFYLLSKSYKYRTQSVPKSIFSSQI